MILTRLSAEIHVPHTVLAAIHRLLRVLWISCLKAEDYEAIRLSNVSLDTLCSKYICKDIPVIIWATMDMQKPYVLNTWVCDGKTINWIVPEHCLLLVG